MLEFSPGPAVPWHRHFRTGAPRATALTTATATRCKLEIRYRDIRSETQLAMNERTTGNHKVEPDASRG